MREFLKALPDVLAARDLRDLANTIADARRHRRSFLLMMGAHPLKVGLGPLICSLIRDGTLTAIATNGAAIIHDFELAFAGRTSEDVAAELTDGSFGMVEETGSFLNTAAKTAADEGAGLGEVVGREIARAKFKYRDASIFATAHAAGIRQRCTLRSAPTSSSTASTGRRRGDRCVQPLGLPLADGSRRRALARRRAEPRFGRGDAGSLPEGAQSGSQFGQ